MHVIITGAAGFVGRALAQRLISERKLGQRAIGHITLLDLAFAQPPADGVRQLAGDIGDADWMRSVLGTCAMDVVFHLASIPGGAAESDYALAKRVNLEATQTLLEMGRLLVERGGAPPVLVFASSIAVFGTMSAEVNDSMPTLPRMTYGYQKLIGELLVSDFSRRGWVDGRSVRLPGVLARPPARTGQLSAFLSDMIRELAAGRPFVCPMSPRASTWASSLPCVVEQLVHAAALDGHLLDNGRTVTLPTLCFTMAALVNAVARVYGCAAQDLVHYEPDPRIEALFGRFPPLVTAQAQRAGFQRDADLDTLVRRALGNQESPRMSCMA
ncbi:NAD-dependent epimerase/dehydratase family protein [Rhodoferax sp. GW822-FHT02A01]|uniref:NAD-dependent epimerase/dehydratase family protein n=1 Tax=Rhodoferax sp. GW822-FHT02A01 TaxID=3141537 RepID=UPI00315DCEB0